MVKVDANEATCTENGNTAYWYCEDCGKYFDEEGNEIALADTVVAAKGHSAKKTEAKAATHCTDSMLNVVFSVIRFSHSFFAFSVLL